MVREFTFRNDFHHTEATVRATPVYKPGHISGPPDHYRVSARAWRRMERKLCPFDGCLCGGIRPRRYFERVCVNGRADHVRI